MNAAAKRPPAKVPAEVPSPVYFDYALQAWVIHGKVEPCEHPLEVRQAAWREGRHCCAQHKLAGLRALDVPGHESPLMVTYGQAAVMERMLMEHERDQAQAMAENLAYDQAMDAVAHG